MSDDLFVFELPDLPLSAFPVMTEIRRRGKLCDVTLKVEEKKFSAHRIVLAATIPYFHAMFTHDMVEARQAEIEMQGIEPTALESFINYAYDGRLTMDKTTVQSLLVGASFLNLTEVKDACCKFMKSRLHPSNVIATRSFAEQFLCTSLIDACNKYLQKYFVDVCHCDEFHQLSLSDVTELLSRDELHVGSEEQVFEALMSWVEYDESRWKHVSVLLENVRLPLLTPQFLTDTVGQHQLIKNCLRCRDLLDEAKDYHLMPERRTQLHTFRTRPRSCTDVVGVVYAVGGLTSSGDSVSTVECMESADGPWRVAEPMCSYRSRMGMAVLKGQIFAVGGYDGQERLNTVEMFDPSRQQWKAVSAMRCKRSALGAAVLGGQLYVCGGYDGVSSLSSVECYDRDSNSWTMVSHMTRHRSAAGVTVFDGQMYALGGHDGLSIFDSVESYSRLAGTWTQQAPMLLKRCRLGAAALGGRLYAAGGYDGSVFLKSVECYDPVSGRWSLVAPMNVKRSRVALVANCGKLYAVGGYDGFSNLNSVECFDPELNVWTFTSPMCAHDGGVGVVVLPKEPTL